MNYCILNGIKSTNIKGLIIQSLPPISKPLMRTSTEEIDGRDGDVVTKLGFSAYDRVMTIGLFGDYDIDEVITYFNSEGTVIFSNEPDKFYYYQILQQINFERLARFKTATVTFHVQPFKWSAVDDNLVFSVNQMRLKPFTTTKNGVTIKVEKGLISVQGTSVGNTQVYLPIIPMTLDAKSYTLQAITQGSGENGCAVRVVDDNPSDANSLGGRALALQESGSASFSATLQASKTFNYAWISINSGTVCNFVLDLEILDYQSKSFEFFNRGNTTSRPKLTVHGSGTINLSINGVQLFTISLGNAEYITLDGLEMNAYKGDVLMNRQVTGDYANLIMKQGTNIISWAGDVSKVVVENGSRWI